MRCFCCSVLLPLPLINYYDQPSDRWYCLECFEAQEELYQLMYMKINPRRPFDEVQVLDEDFDYDDLSSILPDFPSDDDFSDMNLLPENYDE